MHCRVDRYYYLVYNASVIYWEFCRPLFKLNFKQRLISSLQQIVQALDDVNDQDHIWRAELKMYVINSLLLFVPVFSHNCVLFINVKIFLTLKTLWHYIYSWFVFNWLFIHD